MMMININLIIFFTFIIQIYSYNCSEYGCKKCISNETCSNCRELYDQSDNSCSNCIALDPYQSISEINRLIVKDNGICTDKSHKIKTKYDDVKTIKPNGEEITLHFSSETEYSIGPCSHKFNHRRRYRGSIWLIADLSEVSSEFINVMFTITTPNTTEVRKTELNLDFTPTPFGNDEMICYARHIVRPGGITLTIPLPRQKNYLFFSVANLIEFDVKVKLQTTVHFNRYLSLDNEFIKQLYQQNKNYTTYFPIMTYGDYFYSDCAPGQLLNGIYFTIQFDGPYTVLFDTTNQKINAYLIEVRTNENGAFVCKDFWSSEWWGIWNLNSDIFGLKVRIKGGSSLRHFFLVTKEHLADIAVTFAVICPNNCYEENGFGKCSLKEGKCLCNETYGANDCRKLCYYKNEFYQNGNKFDGKDMCYFGTHLCDYDCHCIDSKLENHYCVSNNCASKNFNDKSIQCEYQTDNCLPNCQCKKGYSPTKNHLCKPPTCGNKIVDIDEECDGGYNCNEICKCISGFIIDNDNPGSCKKKTLPYYVWILLAFGIIILLIIFIIIVYLIIRFSTTETIEEFFFRKQQPSYYEYTIKSKVLQPRKETRYNVYPLHLGYGNESTQTNIMETRYQTINVHNYSNNKYLMMIIHTPNDPKYVFHFDPQVLYLFPHQSQTCISYITLHCTTKIKDMKIPFTLWWSKSKTILNQIEQLLKDKTDENWTDEDEIQMKQLLPMIKRRQYYHFEIKTESQTSTHLDFDELNLSDDPLSETTYNKRYLGEYRSIPIVVTQFKLEQLDDNAKQQIKESIINECELLSKIRNPHIVSYIGSVTYLPEISIVTQFLPIGSLKHLIDRKNTETFVLLPYHLKIRMLYDIVKGMIFLHENNIMHSNLNPETLLVNSLLDDANCCIRLSTIGSTNVLYRKLTQIELTRNDIIYIAPECYDNEFLFESDIFSFAVIAWELFYMKEPYEECSTVNEIKSFVSEGKRLSFDESIPNKLQELIELCWKEIPSERPKFDIIFRKLHDISEDAINHPELDENVSYQRIEQITKTRSYIV